MKNFIARTITGILFVAAVVVSFLDPVAMIALFCLVTGRCGSLPDLSTGAMMCRSIVLSLLLPAAISFLLWQAMLVA